MFDVTVQAEGESRRQAQFSFLLSGGDQAISDVPTDSGSYRFPNPCVSFS